MNQSRDLVIGTRSQPQKVEDVHRDAELEVQNPVPDQVDDRDRQDVGQEEQRQDRGLQPPFKA
jgi:hypothetical protein